MATKAVHLELVLKLSWKHSLREAAVQYVKRLLQKIAGDVYLNYE